MQLLKKFPKQTRSDSISLTPNEPEKERPQRALKGKAIALQAWTGPEGSRRLRLPKFQDNRDINPLKPNDPYRGRTAPLTS